MARLIYLIVKIYILVILFGYNHLYKIYYTFKKKFKCFIDIKKEKEAKNTNDNIYMYNNMSIPDLWGN